MSWSVSTDAHRLVDLGEAIDHAEPGAHLSDSQRGQLDGARELAHQQVASFAGGADPEEDERYFRVHLSGHAEGDTQFGKPGDHISVKVEQAPAP